VICRSNIGKYPGGFTLLELLVVMVIIGLVFSLVPPLFSSAVPGARLKGAARDLAVGLRYARSQAITHNTEIAVRLNLEPPAYTIGGEQPQALPDDVRMTVTSAATENVLPVTHHMLQFYPDGSSTGSQITLSGGHLTYHLDVDWLTGRIGIVEEADDAR
jgi:general secretion pathway protein H